ncbi:MarR family transcriptional regulator [Aeromonas hydrophila]|uniref:MarR family transcriptional regulator n=1 Tax=Aeromonas hydrophila TaxID=644 RepID=UPI003EC55F94
MAITAPQFALLTMLDAYPGSSNAELARLTLLTPQTVSPMVTSLEPQRPAGPHLLTSSMAASSSSA